MRRTFTLSPADRALEDLRRLYPGGRAHKSLSVSSWAAPCPACNSAFYGDWEALVVSEAYEGGPVRLRCSQGCQESQVLAALAGPDHRPDPVDLALLDDVLELVDAVTRRINVLETCCRALRTQRDEARVQAAGDDATVSVSPSDSAGSLGSRRGLAWQGTSERPPPKARGSLPSSAAHEGAKP